MSDFREKFRQAGFVASLMSPGDIFSLKDASVIFPEVELGQSRTLHDFRTVLILSRQKTCDNALRYVVTIAPMSSKVDVRTELEVIVDPDLYNNLKVRSRIALGHIQPVLKRDLDRKIGHLGPRDLDGVITRHLMNLGIIEG